MTTVTERKSRSFCRYERRKRLSGGAPVGFEPLSWFKPCLFGSSRRQFPATPPARKLLAFGLCHRTQGPQKPEGRRNHLNPDLNAPFSFSAIKLPTGQPQIAFHKSDAVFNTEAFFINRLGLARRRQFDLERCGHEDQP